MNPVLALAVLLAPFVAGAVLFVYCGIWLGKRLGWWK